MTPDNGCAVCHNGTIYTSDGDGGVNKEPCFVCDGEGTINMEELKCTNMNSSPN